MTTPPPLPTKGKPEARLPIIPLSPFSHPSQMLAGLGHTPTSVSFPQFAGENPNLSKTLCEQYFSMFAIASSFWFLMAALNFTRSATIWLQSIQKRLGELDWDSFTTLLCARFGRDCHQMLIR